MLKAMSIEDEKIDQIIEAHGETVEALKEDRDNYKTDAAKLTEVQAELAAARKNLPAGETVAKTDYDKLEKEYSDYKAEILAKQTHANKEAAFKKLLTDAGISSKRLDAIIKVSKVDELEIDDNGNLKNSETLAEDVKNEWSDFIVTQDIKGADTAEPPEGDNAKKDPFLEGFGD